MTITNTVWIGEDAAPTVKTCRQAQRAAESAAAAATRPSCWRQSSRVLSREPRVIFTPRPYAAAGPAPAGPFPPVYRFAIRLRGFSPVTQQQDPEKFTMRRSG